VSALDWLAFGDGAVWGLTLLASDAAAGQMLLGAGGEARLVDAEFEPAEVGFRLHGDGLELAISPEGRATGSVLAGESERDIDAPAWRLAIGEDFDSLRLAAGWFDEQEALALLALRSRKARGQEADRIQAVLVEAAGAQTVSDPRLSTTYTGDGVPSRVGVELWVSEPSDEPESSSERPHRAAGEAAGPGVSWHADGLELGAQPFRWHSHGRDGTGVYVLGRAA
jgi:hypothetical protein